MGKMDGYSIFAKIAVLCVSSMRDDFQGLVEVS